jgi:hypothetical protein
MLSEWIEVVSVPSEVGIIAVGPEMGKTGNGNAWP